MPQHVHNVHAALLPLLLLFGRAPLATGAINLHTTPKTPPHDSSSLHVGRRTLVHGTATAVVLPGSAMATTKRPEFILSSSALCMSVAVLDIPLAEWIAEERREQRPAAQTRRIVCQTTGGGTLLLTFLPGSALVAAIEYDRGRVNSVHYVRPTNFRVPTNVEAARSRYMDVDPGTALEAWSQGPLRTGQGIMFGAHGLTVGYPLWLSKFTSESSDEEHRGRGVVRSIAGQLLQGSTNAPLPGPAVLHVTEQSSDAAMLAAHLDPASDARVRQALELGVMRAPIYAVSAEVVSDHTY